jgi:hypothetical protein
MLYVRGLYDKSGNACYDSLFGMALVSALWGDRCVLILRRDKADELF